MLDAWCLMHSWWLMAHGSWLMAHGEAPGRGQQPWPWAMIHVPWAMTHQACIKHKASIKHQAIKVSSYQVVRLFGYDEICLLGYWVTGLQGYCSGHRVGDVFLKLHRWSQSVLEAALLESEQGLFLRFFETSYTWCHSSGTNLGYDAVRHLGYLSENRHFDIW